MDLHHLLLAGLPGALRSTPESGLKSDITPGPVRANNRHCLLFDHLVGAAEQRDWDRDPQLLGCLEIDQ